MDTLASIVSIFPRPINRDHFFINWWDIWSCSCFQNNRKLVYTILYNEVSIKNHWQTNIFCHGCPRNGLSENWIWPFYFSIYFYLSQKKLLSLSYDILAIIYSKIACKLINFAEIFVQNLPKNAKMKYNAPIPTISAVF